MSALDAATTEAVLAVGTPNYPAALQGLIAQLSRHVILGATATHFKMVELGAMCRT